MKTNMLYGQDILSADQFSQKFIQSISQEADVMRALVAKKGGSDILKGKIMTALFYEPSSRTIGSFITAMQRLGGGFVPLQGMTNSSVAKGETLADTVRTFASYSDIIVIRHSAVGAAAVAAEFSNKPVINAGDGPGEHPTQALLDMYTIMRHFGTVKGRTITMVGDMKNGRTVHSLAKLLSLYSGITIRFIAPPTLQFPDELRKKLIDAHCTVYSGDTLEDILPVTDALYVTRVQKERFTDLKEYEELKHRFVITPKTLRAMKKTAIIMHPLPRIGEIDMDVDLDPRAVYIREQMENGMYVRMALLKMILVR